LSLISVYRNSILIAEPIDIIDTPEKGARGGAEPERTTSNPLRGGVP